MKEIKNKTVVIVTAFIAVVLIIVLLLTQCGKKGTDKEKEQSGSKEPGKEVIIDEKEDEAGLTVGTPEDADKEQGNNQVEFVGPENTSDGKTNANGTGNTDAEGDTGNKTEKDETQKNENDDDKTDEDKTDKDKDTGNLDEEKDSTGQYGEFF